MHASEAKEETKKPGIITSGRKKCKNIHLIKLMKQSPEKQK
jgi:hypothetical protein